MSHLSIGEVLGLLLEEFPDVTISKIRFLESQGLIDPERTPSGYRKFYDDDVELLRCILREQRENYLPLRVIKDRIDSGEIDPTGEQARPRGIRNVGDHTPHHAAQHASLADNGELATGAAALFMRTDGERAEPAAPVSTPSILEPTPAAPAPSAVASSAAPAAAVAPRLLPGVLLDARELCSMSGISASQLDELLSYGVLAAESRAEPALYNEDALEIANNAKHFLDAGVDARHLRGWRVAAEREAGLLDQLVQPLLRQRNPDARAQAMQQLVELEAVGGRLRSAMMREALRSHTH